MSGSIGPHPSVCADGLPSPTVGGHAHCRGHQRWRCDAAEEGSDEGDVSARGHATGARALECGARAH